MPAALPALVLLLTTAVASGQSRDGRSVSMPLSPDGRPVFRQPSSPDERGLVPDKELATRPRWSLVVPTVSLGAAALVGGIGLSIAAGRVGASSEERLDELIDRTGGRVNYPCAPGTPFVEPCVEIAEDAERAALLEPLGAGFIAAGLVLEVAALVFAIAAPERDEEGEPPAVGVMVSPGAGGVSVEGRF